MKPGEPDTHRRVEPADGGRRRALPSAMAAAHRLVVAVQRGAAVGDTTPDGATLSTVMAVVGRHLPPDALHEALTATRARLHRADGPPDAAIDATLEWADTLLDPITADPATATELALAAAGADGPTGPGAPDPRLLGRAAFRRGNAAHLDGRPDDARAWFELARDAGHAGAARALDSLAATAPRPASPGLVDPDAGEDGRRLIAEILAEAEQAERAGDPGTAADRYRRATDLLPYLIESEPHDPEPRRWLADAHRARADVLAEGGDPAAAVAAYDEADAAWAPLGAGPAPADVALGRARAHDLLGHSASALAATETAVVALLDRFTGDADDPLTLEVARALARHAHVVAGHGDPDVASAAADTAVRLYLARSDEINASPRHQARHVPAFHRAAITAWAVHAVAGRTRRAAEAAELASATGEGSVPLHPEAGDPRDRVRGRLSLDGALTRADALALRATLVAPAVDATVLCTTHRCPPGATPATARQLARLAGEMLAEDLDVGLRLTLEAHVLLAGASSDRAPGGADRFATLGPVWLELLADGAQACEAAGRRALARDLARWTEVVGRRLIHARALDQPVP